MKQIFILTGEGIECEKESLRFFQLPVFQASVKFCPVPQIVRGESDLLTRAVAGDWVVFPGGFSFADHFGSGKLLAYKLSEAKFFQRALAAGLHLLGTCNGFQVLTAAGLFGNGVRLEHNEVNEKDIGFVNRWTECLGLGMLAGKAPYQLPVRHGEGRLVRTGSAWADGVTPFLQMHDAHFDNGSIDGVVGLSAKIGRSRVFGLMPHPEIAMRPLDHPDAIGPEFTALFRSKNAKNTGDGVRLMTDVFEAMKES